MKFKQSIQPARVTWHVNRTMRNGEVYEYYGSEVYETRYLAERAICLRFRKYRDQMSIVEVHEPETTVLTGHIVGIND